MKSLIMIKRCCFAMTCLISVNANAFSMESFYGTYHFSADEISGYLNEKPLEKYHGTLTLEAMPSYLKTNKYEATATISVNGGAFHSGIAKVRHGRMIELHYTNRKGQQVVAFCAEIDTTAHISKCEGSLSGNMNATTIFSLTKE